MRSWIASRSVHAERYDAVTRTTQAGDTSVDNCGYPGGHIGACCGFAVGTESVITRRPKPKRDSSTRRPQAERAPDLRTRRFSTVSTGAKNPMESVESSQSTKRSSGPTWGKPHSRAGLPDLSGCPQSTTTSTTRRHRNDADATRPKRHVTPGWRTSHLSVAGSAWHTAESGGTQR
jgi:hypothetical protein